MSYKYFYRIKYERAIGNNEWAVGSITEQFRNSPLTSRDFNLIRSHIFDEMDAFNVTEVRACIYRISDFDWPGVGEFDGTENDENNDYEHLCDRYVPLVAIFHITNYLCFTYYGWYDCGRLRRHQFHCYMAEKKLSEVKINGHH